MIRHRYVWALAGPYILVLAVFLLLPAAGLLEVSFRQHSPVAITGLGFSTGNYARLTDLFYAKIIWRTVQLALFSTLIATILAYPVAYVIARSQRRARAILTCLVMVPLMTSIVVKSFGWYILLNRGGTLPSMLAALGFPRQSLLGNDIAVLVGLSEFALPFMVFSLTASIERIPILLEEAANNLGAGRLSTFFKVIVPLSRPGLLSGFLLCFGVSSSAYVVPAVMGSLSARMVAQQIFDDVLVAFNWPGGAALSVVLLVLLGSVLYTALAFGNRARS